MILTRLILWSQVDVLRLFIIEVLDSNSNAERNARVDLDGDLDIDFVSPKRNQLWNPNRGFRLHDTAMSGRVSESQTSCLLRDMTFI
jgi:hypothetical protein